jgi:hypothetical protein
MGRISAPLLPVAESGFYGKAARRGYGRRVDALAHGGEATSRSDDNPLCRNPFGKADYSVPQRITGAMRLRDRAFSFRVSNVMRKRFCCRIAGCSNGHVR